MSAVPDRRAVIREALEDVNNLRQLVGLEGYKDKLIKRLGARLSGLLRSLRKAERR